MENVTVIIPRRGINDEGKGKKYALLKLISAAQTEYVWLQDDDVTVNSETDLSCGFEGLDLLILPLTMTAGGGSLVEQLQQLEYVAIQSLTLWAAENNHPVMCSGANLIVKRERWLESYPDLHTEIPSGDDMFLLESFKRRGLKIGMHTHPVATIQPLPSLRQLLRQRMRWAGKAPKYKDKDILLCGVTTFLTNLFLWFPPVFISKYIFDMWLIHRGVYEYKLLKNKKLTADIWLLALLLEVVYPLYMFICLLGGLFRQNKW